ncbi:DinB family protein [Virgibacillus sp. W0181]|uniref:DinB family protein n=1 Tax=Virgibacillus sp. W0181 TaxID=3391581 RepID=UPI003F454709
MKSESINHHFQTITNQRNHFYHNKELDFNNAWERPKEGKWSIGETVYHLVLLARMFRRFSIVYIPVMRPVAHLRRGKPFKKEIHNIYEEFNQKKKKPMNAPYFIKPGANLEEKWTFLEVRNLLELETNKLYRLVNNIEERVAGQIYYPDPIAYYPNLIQAIHLLGIHEQHHFDLMKKYYSS